MENENPSRSIENLMFVSNVVNKSVSVIDTQSLEKIQEIEVDGFPYECVFNSEGTYLFVSMLSLGSIGSSTTISVIDTHTLKNIKKITVGRDPLHIVLSMNGLILFVVNSDGNSVSVIDTQSMNKITTDILVGKKPGDAILSADGKDLFVMNKGCNSITVIDTQTLKKKKDILDIGNEPFKATLSKNGNHLFVLNQSEKSVTVVDILTLQKTQDVKIDIKPGSSVLSADGAYLFVAPSYNTSGDFVTVIDTEKLQVIRNIGVEFSPRTILLSNDGKYVFTGNSNGPPVSVIDTQTLQKIQDIPKSAFPGMKYGNLKNLLSSTDGETLFVLSNMTPATVFAVNTETMTCIKNFKVGDSADFAVIFKPDEKYKLLFDEIKETVDAIKKREHNASPEVMSHVIEKIQQLRDGSLTKRQLSHIANDVLFVITYLKETISSNNQLFALEDYFKGVQYHLDNPIKEDTLYKEELFQKAFEDIDTIYNGLKKYYDDKKSAIALKDLHSDLDKIFQKYPDLAEIEKVILRFIGLQSCAAFIDDADKVLSKQKRLSLLNYIDGYEFGVPLEIPLPGMVEEKPSEKGAETKKEAIDPEKEKAEAERNRINQDVKTDNRTTHDFLDFIQRRG